MNRDHADAGSDVAERIHAGNRRHVERFADADAPKRPARALFVVTCMDARVDPLRLLDLQVGDAHVVRNAGGRVTEDALRSLTVSATLLGTRHAVVIHHTDCGLHAGEATLRAALADAGVDTAALSLYSFEDLAQSVRDDIEALRGHRYLARPVEVSGYIYDVSDGQLREVECG